MTEAGLLRQTFPELEPEDMAASCSLDIAALGPNRLETVGELLNITRERARQIEDKARYRFWRHLPADSRVW